jgi:hypothetical protein
LFFLKFLCLCLSFLGSAFLIFIEVDAFGKVASIGREESALIVGREISVE